MLTIAGAGMAGLCAAARARELGLAVTVLEKGDRPGGSMLLSSGVIWRHRTLEAFRAECPGGDPVLQETLVERLDEAIGWLETLGAEVLEQSTGNRRTTGKRFDPRSLTDALVRKADNLQLGTSLPDDRELPVVLATGGFAAELARASGLALRANRWSDGAGLRFGQARGAATYGDLEEFYGRVLPAATVAEWQFVQAAQLYGRHAVVLDGEGTQLPVELSWSEVELPQALARAGGDGWLVVDGRALRQRVRARRVADMVAAAGEVGGEVRRASSLEGLGLPLRPSPRLAEPPFVAVRVAAGVTHTIGGLRIDRRARVLGADGPVAGLYACGADVGGIATGGYASGLAAALVFGRIAAETAAAGV